MSVLIQQDTESAVIAKNTGVSLNCGAGNKTPWRITAPAFYSLPSVRKKKIIEIRRQLIEGRYDIDKRSNIAMDRLLEDLIAMDRMDYLCPKLSF
jgi:hypothetical protein